MTVDLIARAFLAEPHEMPAAIRLARSLEVDLTYDEEELLATLSLTGPPAVEGQAEEPYLLKIDFDHYRTLPPGWRFVDPRVGEEIGKAAYPQPIGGSILHSNGVVCAHWNRFAYSANGGPHGDWGNGDPASWQTTRPSETVALHVPDMLDRLVREVRSSRGRMAPLP